MECWRAVERELDAWVSQGRTARVWLRDDDATDVSAQLDTLAGMTGEYGIPVLLATVPKPATKALASWLDGFEHITPCCHGFAHTNHAPPGEKAQELGNHRPLEAVTGELRLGREKLLDLFGARLADIMVPPWNRIAPAVANALPGLGLSTLSTFAGQPCPETPGLKLLPTQLDIIDWKGNRGGRDHGWLCAELTRLLIQARKRQDMPIGILTHHLDHDERAWQFLKQLFSLTATHPGFGWRRATTLV